jgi:hypothetical protein
VTSQPILQLLPAVDVVGGRAVQLVQGVAGTGGDFGDPLQAALAWQEQGRSGCTSSTSTLPSVAAPTRTCSRASSERSTSTSR